LDRCSPEHQRLQADAAKAAAIGLQKVELPPVGIKGRKTAAYDAMKVEVWKVRDYGLLMGLPVEPDASTRLLSEVVA
jgi:hypothetical protein